MTDRLPPHDTEAEASFIGCLLSGEAEYLNAALGEAAGGLFYDLRHQTIFAAVEGLVAQGTPISIATVRQHLKSAGKLEGAGGLAYLTACLDGSPSPSVWFHFLEIVRQKAQLRKLSAACAAIAAQVHDSQDPDDLIANAERSILAVRGSDVRGEVSMRELVIEATQAMEQDATGQFMRGPSTRLQKLDNLIRGLAPKKLVVIAARPTVGKSALAMQIADCIAVDDNLPVLVFSLEMPAVEVTERILRRRARVADTRQMTNDDMVGLNAASVAVMRAPLVIFDQCGITVGQIQARARRAHQRQKLGLIVVDYLQLVSCGNGKGNRATDLGEVSVGLKVLANELGVPVIAIASVNRDCERENRPPRMSDLRECGNIEFDADVILMLHTEKDNGGSRQVQIRVEKNKGGPRGVVDTVFNCQLTEFRECDPIDPADIPQQRRK